MSTPFHLEILTPEHQFFSDDVEALTISTLDGEMTILKDHAPITAPLQVGSIRIKQNGVWREAFQSEGFLEVTADGAHLFVQACEWPENIDGKRANEARIRAERRLAEKNPQTDIDRAEAALKRALVRLSLVDGN